MKAHTKVMMAMLAGGIPKDQAREWIQKIREEAEGDAWKKAYNEGWTDGVAYAGKEKAG